MPSLTPQFDTASMMFFSQTPLELLLRLFMLVFSLLHLSYSLDRFACLFEHTSMGKVFNTSVWHSSLKVFSMLLLSYSLGFHLLVSLSLSSLLGGFRFLLFKFVPSGTLALIASWPSTHPSSGPRTRLAHLACLFGTLAKQR